MTPLEERVRHLFGLSMETKMAIADSLSATIAIAGSKLAECLLKDKKILLCGNGGSVANCLHFATAMLNHFDVERPPLPAIVLSKDAILTATTNEAHEQVFARQILALGQEGDILLVLTTCGNANNILHAVSAANDRNMDTIALTGNDGGLLANHLGPEDIEIRVQGDSPPRIREMQLFILHCFCDLIDLSLFGGT